MHRILVGAGAVLLGLSFAGCGDSSPNDPALRFVGTWQYAAAKAEVTCPGGDPIDETPTGNKRIERGTMHDLVDVSPILIPPIYCDFAFDIDGPEAKGVVNQGCALRGGDLLTLKTWSFALTGPDQAEEVAQADASLTFLNQPAPVMCSYTSMAKLTRVSKD
jgi:hypothetical protein